MTSLTLTTVLTAFASLTATLFIMKFFAHVIQTRITSLNACFLCVLSTSLIMAAAIHMTPSTAMQEESFQFLIAVTVSSLVYHAFLNASLIKSIFLAATNFMVQIFTLLGFSLAVNLAQAQQLIGS